MLLGVVLALGVRSTIGVVGRTSWVDHTHRVIESIDEVELAVSLVVIARRGYALTGDLTDVATYNRARQAVPVAVQRLRTLTKDNPRQQQRLDLLEPVLARDLVGWDAALAFRRDHGFEPVAEAAASRFGANAYRDLSDRASELIAEEQRLLVTREKRTEESLAQTRTLEVVGACFGLMLITIVVTRLRREILRRVRSEATLRESEQAIAQLNQTLERRIESRTAQLQMANDELELFSYSLVHDLRAPLRGMGSFADILLAEYTATLDEGAREYLVEIQANARKMAVLIDALDAMSRITRCEVVRTPIDVSRLVRVVTGQIRAATPGAIETVVQEGLTVDADARLVQMLFEVLIGNSHKFSSERVEAGDAAIEDERVLFVKDNGIGFDMAHYDKLFSPFGRLHTVGEFPGVGIGLAMAQRIVRRHGGRIWADARVGQGATFYFTLHPSSAVASA